MNQEKIGKFIASCRKEKNLTQEMLAEKLGVSKNAVSKWERGLNLPDASLYKELCDILDISLTELFNGDYIKLENLKETADEVLYEQINFSTKNIIKQIIYSIIQGIGVALLFVPIYKSFNQTMSAVIVFIGFMLFVIGLSLKIKNINK